MKKASKTAGGGKAKLNYVSENLYRHETTRKYYGMAKIHGRRVLHCLDGTTDATTAKGKLAEWLAGLTQKDPLAANLKLDALLDKWLGLRAARSPRTLTSDESRAVVFRATFTPGMGARVDRIRTSDLGLWLQKTSKARKWSGSTYNKYRMMLKGMFKLAVADRVISKSNNPFDPELIAGARKTKTKRHIPTPEQFAAILEHTLNGCPKCKYEKRADEARQSFQFNAILGMCGVGQGEAANMKVKDLGVTLSNPVDERVQWTRQKTRFDFKQPIFPEARALIAELREQHKLSLPETPVFTIQNADGALDAALEHLNLPHFTPRNLRAMWIKRRYDEGWSVKQIAEWQGHRDGGVLILSIYTEVFSDSDEANLRAALTELDKTGKVNKGEKVVAFHAVA